MRHVRWRTWSRDITVGEDVLEPPYVKRIPSVDRLFPRPGRGAFGALRLRRDRGSGVQRVRMTNTMLSPLRFQPVTYNTLVDLPMCVNGSPDYLDEISAAKK